MRRYLFALPLLGAIGLAACGQQAPQNAGADKAPVVMGTYADDPVKRGQYIVRIGSCNDCHTPWVMDEQTHAPRQDMTRMLSGHPSDAPDPIGPLHEGDAAVFGPTFTSFLLPFGTVYSANLTPDKESGLGNWTEEMFINALRTGRHMGGNGRGIFPPMPWLWVRNLSDEDLHAVWSYLQTIPPVYNVVPSSKIPTEMEGPLRAMDEAAAAALPHEEWATRGATPSGQ